MAKCYSSNRYTGRYRGGSSWSSKYTLNVGSAWEDEYSIATLALEIVMVVVLVGILIWSMTSRRRTAAARKSFVWFIAAISLTIFTFTWDFINRILNEECLRVQRVYLIFNVIFGALRYLSETLLLATIYTYLIPRSILTNPGVPKKTTPLPLLLHLIFCALLALFWLIITILVLAAAIQSVIGGGAVPLLNLIDGSRRLVFVFTLFYFLASLEILALSLAALTARSTEKSTTSNAAAGSGRNLQQPPLLFLLTTIALPLLIRTTWQLATTATYSLRSRYAAAFEPAGVQLAHLLFYYLCTGVVFAGLVVVMKRRDDEDEEVVMEVGDGSEGKMVGDGARVSRDHREDLIFDGP
ncbi:MAG: hypothetical protein Q9182_006298 [Xanthomendoza sp. 2 TL-2023]